jgi:phosphatidylethanolamine-binding protein (PEBP) family uncharacterized protein
MKRLVGPAFIAFLVGCSSNDTQCLVCPDEGSGGSPFGGAGGAPAGGASSGGASPGAGGASAGGSSAGGASSGGTSAGGTSAGGAASGGTAGASSGGSGGAPAELTLTSTVFHEGEQIPSSYRCDAPSPDLAWSGGPAALSYAIVFRDVTPGVSNGFLHWVLYDVPPATTSLAGDVAEGYSPATPAGAHQAPIWNGDLGFNGPCGGVNTYEMTLYALDVATLTELSQASPGNQAREAILAHEIASTTLTITSRP